VSVERNSDITQAILKRWEVVIKEKGVCDENYEYRVADLFFFCETSKLFCVAGTLSKTGVDNFS
jgi:hypothetical protein